MAKEIIVTEESTPSVFIQQAIKQGLSADHLEKLMALQERWNANIARTSFNEAMTKFQQKCPVIKKTKKVFEKNSTKARYEYAPLDSIVDQVKDLLAECGLSYTIKTTNTASDLTATLKITHVLGHSQENSFVVPIGTEQYMSDVQKFGARATFAKRYAFCDGFGIMTGDGDTDATRESLEDDDHQPAQTKGERFNQSTGEIYPEPHSHSTSKGGAVQHGVFDPAVEQITFGKHKGLEWAVVEKSYLDWLIRDGKPESKEKAMLTLKYLEAKDQQFANEPDPLDAVFGKAPEQKKDPAPSQEIPATAEVFDVDKEREESFKRIEDELKKSDAELKAKATAAIAGATNKPRLDAISTTAREYFNTGKITEDTFKAIGALIVNKYAELLEAEKSSEKKPAKKASKK